MKKSTKIIIAVISVLIVVAVATVAVLYFTTDLFKTNNPKKAFYEYLSKSMETEEGSMSYSEMLKSLKDAQNKSYEGKGNISMDVKLDSAISSDENDAIVEILNNADISFETKADPKNSKSYVALNLKYDGEDLGKIELNSNKDTIGIKCDEITDEYLTITIDEISELLNIDTDMSSMESVDVEKLISLLDISDSEINRIIDRYKGVLEDTIPEDNYSSEKEKITVNGKEINATAYTVEVSQKDFINLAKALITSLQDDDDTIELIVDKVNAFMDMVGQIETLNKRDVTSLLDTILDQLEEIDGFSDEKLVISIYEYKDQTVRIQISFGETAIILDSMKDGDTTDMSIKMKSEGTEMTLMNISSTKKGEGQYTTKLSTDMQGYKIELTVDSESSDSSEKENMKLYIDFPSIIEATLNINSEIEYKSVNIDTLSSSNTTSITKLTAAEQTQLSYGLLKYIDSHMDVIKDIATELGYEDEIIKLEKQINSLKEQMAQPTDADVATDEDTVEE